MYSAYFAVFSDASTVAKKLGPKYGVLFIYRENNGYRVTSAYTGIALAETRFAGRWVVVK